ncbi:MAG TPA: CAP domain-containing protein [Acinetobacter sp.]|nr:CAP domain-containing protein [Acinetobacter sp.]
MKNFAFHFFTCGVCFFLASCSSPPQQQPSQKYLGKITQNSTTLPTQNTPDQILASFENISCDDIQNPQYQQAVLNAINVIRHQPQQCGKIAYSATNSLRWNNQLQASSIAHAQDISQRQLLSHVGHGGENLRFRIKQTGYKGGGGENLASGQSNLKQVLENWLSLSPGHCDNLMKPQFKDYAISCIRNETTHRTYWMQHFGSGKN